MGQKGQQAIPGISTLSFSCESEVAMKIKTIAPLFFFLFLAAAGFCQDNSCAYTFTYPKADNAVGFSFCLTVWGTLASIQSPIGVNHLDPVNPVEGWSAFISDADGGSDGGVMIPGLGAVSFVHPPVVTQPKGPGTLPLIFDYYSGFFVERVDAVPYQREIVLTLTFHSCPESDCYWFGIVTGAANIRPDGNSTGHFAHSAFAAFGYVNHGVMVSMDESQSPCAGIDPNGASATPGFDCFSISNPPFTGPGAVLGSWVFYSQAGRRMSMKATYRVF
jgi:hypothetical protein